MSDLCGVALGGLIGFLSAFVVDIVRARREEKRWYEELKAREKESAVGYFRGIYNSLAPFLSIPHRMVTSMGAYAIEELASKEPRAKETYDILSKMFTEWSINLNDFINKGYVGLLPPDLGQNVTSYAAEMGILAKSFKQKRFFHEWTSQDRANYKRLVKIGKEIRDRIRQILNVNVLDTLS